MNSDPEVVLSRLHDVLLPPPVGWWPLAEVWWFIIVGLLGFVTWFLWFLWRNWHLAAYRREAVQRLHQLHADWQAGKVHNPVEAINVLMKQVAVTAYTPEQRGRMYGDAWVDFLRKSAVRVKAPDDLPCLLGLAYRQDVSRETEAVERLFLFAEQWIRRHHQ